MHALSTRRFLIVTAGILLTAALWGRGNWVGVVVAQEARKTAERHPLVLDRAPIRVITDANPVFSGIAMDMQRNEVIMTNDNDASQPSIMVYPSQFPPTDKVMEPRRRIAGPQSDLGLPCAVAVSPEYHEMYTVSGDGQELNTYPLEARGDVPPSRQISVPHSAGGLFLDSKSGELFMTTEHVNKISVYRRTAQGEEDPLRYIQGPRTGLADPHGIYVDNEKREIFVTNHGHWRKTEPGEGFQLRGEGKLARVRGSYSYRGIVEPLAPSTGKFIHPSITVYRQTAQGDVAPLRTIQGSNTRLNLPLGIARDPVSGQLVVANSGDDSVLFFDGNATGDVAPVRVLQGPATDLKSPTGVLIDTTHNELWVTNWFNHTASVFPRMAKGDVAPLRAIRSAPKGTPLATMGRPGAVGYDPKRKQVLAPN
ncbi:MAG: hypothetical protein HYX72_03970 [Acidobacteria bacterium]|nr:hypothetical protein [Acidobacteriota bacterium]